ncbi:NACHT domain-containing protein [Streptomyces sp. NBC_00190]|uniref:NACHT domain-containing protein n=1 Tax=unclassified Streptomyces TaxID=2593676 RepID=UPI002E292571|nr:NACHT domain-containing protein [Streptomyces sp. NBC_00190]WSZ42933.1 NACHT domain-containing protein [Streptomyces sp. NBC_00868]
MEPGTIGIRLASAAIAPLVRKLFVTEGPGAGLVDKPVRISGHVSFRGEKRSLTQSDLHDLAAKLVKQALRTGERPIPADEQQAVAEALATTLHALGDITLTDLDAVRLGSEALARELRRVSGRPEAQLSADATYFYERLLEAACLHILHFFTQRSTFVAHALVQQTRGIAELTAKVDELIRRAPLPGAEDAAFEQVYLPYVAKRHGKLTIYGIDLSNSPTRWPLDAAYLSLEATSQWRVSLDHVVEVPELAGAGLDLTASTDPQAARTARRVFRQAYRDASGPQPADQALASSHRVLLRGEAGSGKSTLVQWLAVTAARQDLPAQMEYLYDRIPFVLPLRTLTRHGERLPLPQDFLAAAGCPLGGAQPDGWVHRVLATGRGLVLVDGIDEIPDRERERTRGWLRDLMDTYDGDNRWLVTSRPSAVGADWLAGDDFTELTLSAMGPADIATFIERWHKAAHVGTDDDAVLQEYQAQLLAAVRTKPDLGRLATNPLMCGLICALHRDRRGYLPHGRKDLYEAALSMLLSRRDRERDMAGPDLREEPQLDLLQRLAYWLIKNGRTEMDRSRAEDIIARALPSVPEAAALGEARVVFAHFLQRSGLLREPTPGTVDFVHRTFQDFLGARAAVEEGDFGLLAGHAADDQWEDVIRMAVALARPGERVTIIRDLLALGDRSPDKRTEARVYLLAAACLEHATTLDPEVRAAVESRTGTLIPPGNEQEARALSEAGPLILGLLPGPENLDQVDAYYVVIAASHVTSDAAISFLAQFAKHPSLPVRSQLVWAWSRFESARYAEEVIAQLDPADLLYTVQSDEQLSHLDRLGLRPTRLDIRNDVSPDHLATYIGRYSLTEITYSNDTAPDLGFLAGQSALEFLGIGHCPGLTDLDGIEGLPIRYLDITGARPDLDLRKVSQLSQLESLNVRGPSGMSWSAEALPTGAPLEWLTVDGEVSPVNGLKGIGVLCGLRRLVLNAESGPGSEADWHEIRALGSLEYLTVSATSFDALPAGAVLPDVSTLILVGGGGERVLQAAVHRLPAAFTGLEDCRLIADVATEGDTGIDVAPLAGLARLQQVYIASGGVPIRGADLLPPSVDLHIE